MSEKRANVKGGQEIYGLIIAGGSGTRLWPLSRADMPKQLLPLDGGSRSLLQNTFVRLARSIPLERIKIVTSQRHRDQVVAQIRALHGEYPPANVLGEPTGKNSAPAILWGALHTLHECPDASMAVIWSDQHIGREDVFDAGLALGMEMARDGGLAAIGVKPTRPDTGMGYIQQGEPIREGVYGVKRFIEKPGLDTARQFLNEGSYAWNAGIFVFNLQTLLDEFAKHSAHMIKVFQEHGAKLAENDWSDPALMETVFSGIHPAAIDTLLLEKTGRLCVIPCDLDWSDLGSWDVLYGQSAKDRDGNVAQGNAVMVSTRNTMVRAGRRLVATVGVENLVIVDSPDALLVCDMSKVQDVKRLVEGLAAEGRKEVAESATTVRPWGAFTVILESEGFKVKVIEINPGHKLSLQKHKERDEHWVLVEGEGRLTSGGKTRTMQPNDACHIPKGMAHRIENTGKTPLRFVEVQYGAYLGEDDMERMEDA